LDVGPQVGPAKVLLLAGIGKDLIDLVVAPPRSTLA
jgi:hypothetical protein